MKKMLFLVIITALLLSITGGFALSLQWTLFPEEDHVLLDITMFQEELYLLTDEGVFRIEKETGELIPITDAVSGDYTKDNYVDFLCANGNGLYAICLRDNTLQRILDDQAKEAVQTELTFDTDEEIYVFSAILTEKWLCLLLEYDEETRLDFWPLDEGETFSIPTDKAFSVCKDSNGMILYTDVAYNRGRAKYSVVRVNPDSESKESILETEKKFYDICEDQNGKIFLIAQNKVYHWDELQEELVETTGIPGGDIVEADLFANNMIAVIVDNCLAIRQLNGNDTEEAISLVIMEQYGRTEYYKNFITSHPNIDVQFVGSGEMTPEEKFVQDMLLGNDSVDVYLLSDTNMLKTIRERGYYADLAVYEKIRNKVDRMFEPFRNAFSRDGKIHAYPHDIFITSFTCHKAIFEKLEVALPSTYEEFLDFCLTVRDEYEDLLTNVNIDPFVNGMDLLYLLISYTNEQIHAGKLPVYQTEELERVLIKYLELHETFEKTEWLAGNSIPLFYSYDLGTLDDHSAQTYLPLTFEKNAQPLYTPLKNDFSFYVLNPYGKHIQQAVELILNYENMGAFPVDSAAEPIENPGYQKELENMQTILDSLEYELSQQKDEETQERLERMIGQQKDSIKEYETEGRWLISQEQLDRCAILAENVYICEFNPISSAYADNPEMFDNLTKEDIPAFLKKLDSRVQMIMGENE